MPNWIKNQLAVYNIDLIGKTALEVAFGHARPFQRLYPMPKILEETQSPTPRINYPRGRAPEFVTVQRYRRPLTASRL